MLNKIKCWLGFHRYGGHDLRFGAGIRCVNCKLYNPRYIKAKEKYDN